MTHTLTILMVIAMIATALSLIIGIVGMVRGGSFNEKHGNNLMRWRVTLQGLALLLFAAIVMSSKH